MKKKLAILLLIPLLLVGCKKKEPIKKDKMDLLYGRIHEKKENSSYLNVITEAKLNNMLANPAYDTFMLYYFDSTCSGCEEFKPLINKAILNYNLEVYALEASSLNSSSSFIKDGYNTPTIFLYENGEIKNSFSPLDKKVNAMYTQYDALTKFIDDNLILPKVFYINENQFDKKRNDNENFVVMYTQLTCGQCSFVAKGFLKDYIKNTMPKDKKFYLVAKEDVLDPIEGEEKNAYWDAFKSKNGITSTWSDGSENKFGLGTGWTPTYQYWEGNVLKDAAHPFQTYDGEKQEIVRNYYDDDPFTIGTHFENSTEYKEATKDFFFAKLKTFLLNNL